MSSSSENMEIDQEDRRMPNSMIQDEELREQFSRYYVNYILNHRSPFLLRCMRKIKVILNIFPTLTSEKLLMLQEI